MEDKDESLVVVKTDENLDVKADAETPVEENPLPTPTKIKHIVCSGGGVTGLCFYGVLKNLNLSGFWNIENIETIYGTSVGSLVATILALKYDWDILDNYFINRPWKNVFKINMSTILDVFHTKGFFNHKMFVEIFSPLFSGKDISIDVTMKEFFEITNIEMHIFVIEVNQFHIVDVSHKTHPDWKVIDAVYSSCAIPLIFSPHFKEQQCYVDGGILMNYPVDYCIKNGASADEVLGIRGYRDYITPVLQEHSIFDFIIYLVNKTHKRLLNVPNEKITHEIRISMKETTIQLISDVANSMEERIKLIEEGVELSKEFLEKIAALAASVYTVEEL